MPVDVSGFMIGQRSSLYGDLGPRDKKYKGLGMLQWPWLLIVGIYVIRYSNRKPIPIALHKIECSIPVPFQQCDLGQCE